MSLATLLTQRRNKYREQTELLFKAIPAITEGIIEYLSTTDEEDPDADINTIEPIEVKWQEMEVVEDKLVIVADMKPDPIAKTVHRMTIVLPFEMAIDATKDEVVAFLHELAANGEHHGIDDEDDMGAVLSPERVLH